jgi:DNA invertase Pin-like site-specific DNA recombinase
MEDIGLARVSTRDQDPQLQLNALNQAGCWPIYEERVSGASAHRPVRDEVLRRLKRGDTLTVWKLDRLGRSVIELHQIVKDLDQRGIRFRCLTQPIDTTTSQGRFFFTMLAAFAEFERDLIIERTIAGLEVAREQGKFGGPPPYGLTTVKQPDGQVVTVEVQDEAQLLREAARRILDKEPLSRIVEDWNGHGHRPRHAEKWGVTSLRRIMLNERLIPILGQETYDKLVRVFANPDQRKRLGRLGEHLLSGILVCGREGCGRPLYWKSFQDPRGGARRENYVCMKGNGSGGRHVGCGRLTISAKKADEWALEAFIAAVVSEDFTQALDRRRAELLAGEVTVAQVEEWRQEIDDIETVLPTRFGTDAMRERRDELARLVRQATAGLLQRPDLQALVDLPKSEDKLRARWEGWSLVERRTWLKRVFESIAVKPAPPGTHHRGSDVSGRFELNSTQSLGQIRGLSDHAAGADCAAW